MFLKEIDCPTVEINILVTNANKKGVKNAKICFQPPEGKIKKVLQWGPRL